MLTAAHRCGLQLLLACVVIGIASCGPSSPPPVVATPAVEVADKPEESRDPKAEAKVEPSPIPDGGAFPFPDDAGGKALAKKLAPARRRRCPLSPP